MIKIIVKKDCENRVFGFIVQGHSGCAPVGQDIVCAAISALIQALVVGIRDVLSLTPKAIIKDGFSYFELPQEMSKDKTRKAYFLTMTIYRSLLGISEGREEYISLEEVLVEFRKNKKYKIVPLPQAQGTGASHSP